LNEEQLEEAHEILFNVLVGLALLHVAAALVHHFVKRDNILRRMLPG
jgi:cytochrome b561